MGQMGATPAGSNLLWDGFRGLTPTAIQVSSLRDFRDDANAPPPARRPARKSKVSLPVVSPVPLSGRDETL